MRRRWKIATGRGDFLPFVIGFVMLLMSMPSFFLMLFSPERNPGIFAIPLLIILGLGLVVGIGFIVLGVQLCAMPGSLAYRISRGRFFSH